MSKIKKNKYIAHKSRFKLVKSFFEDCKGLFLNKRQKISNRKLLKWAKVSCYLSLREITLRVLHLKLRGSLIKPKIVSKNLRELYGTIRKEQLETYVKILKKRQKNSKTLAYSLFKSKTRSLYFKNTPFFFSRKCFLLKNIFNLVLNKFGAEGLNILLKNPSLYLKARNLLFSKNFANFKIPHRQIFNELALRLSENYKFTNSFENSQQNQDLLNETGFIKKDDVKIDPAEFNAKLSEQNFENFLEQYSFFRKKKRGAIRAIKKVTYNFLLKTIGLSFNEETHIFTDIAQKYLKILRTARLKRLRYPIKSSFISLIDSKNNQRFKKIEKVEFNLIPTLFLISSPINSLFFFKKFKKSKLSIFKSFKFRAQSSFKCLISKKSKFRFLKRKAKRLTKKKLQTISRLISLVKNPQKGVMDKYNPYGRKLHLMRKLRFFFGFMKKRHLLKYKKVAKALPGNANLNFLLQLESRLDIILFRLGVFSSFGEIHSLINNGKVFVNNKKITTSSHQLKDLDSFSIKNKEIILFNTLKRAEFGLLPVQQIPEYIEFDFLTMTGIFLKSEILESNIYLPLSDFGHSYVTNKNLLIALD